MLISENDDVQACFSEDGNMPTDPTQGQRAQGEAGDSHPLYHSRKSFQLSIHFTTLR